MSDFLLVHGLNVDARQWQRLIPLLAADSRAGAARSHQLRGAR